MSGTKFLITMSHIDIGYIFILHNFFFNVVNLQKYVFQVAFFVHIFWYSAMYLIVQENPECFLIPV